jgi:two-component system, cell cycle sensor histidine kinase and response regulator CckA
MVWDRFSSLRSRLVVLVVLAGVPAFALAVANMQIERQREMREAGRNAATVAHLLAIQKERTVGEARGILISLAQVQRGAPLDAARGSDLLRRIRAHYPDYANFGIADPRGDVINSAVPLGGPVNLGNTDFFRRTVATRDFAVGTYAVGRTTGRPVLRFGYPVLGDRGEVTGVVYASLDLDSLEVLDSGMAAILPAGSILTTLDDEGTVLARLPGAAGRVGQPRPDLARLRPLMAAGGGQFLARGERGERYLHALAPVRGTAHAGAMYVVVDVPESAAFAEVNTVFAGQMLALLVILLVVVAGTWVSGSALVLRPVAGLLAVTRRLAAGDLSARIGRRHGRGELGALEQAFDEMAGALEARHGERDLAAQALARSEQQYRAVIQNAPFGIFRSTVAGRLILVNPRLVELLGYASETEVLRLDLPTEVYADAAERERIVALAGQGVATLSTEVRWRRKDGKILTLRANGRLVREPGGGPPYFEVFVEDETERRALEARLEHPQRLEAVGRLAAGVAHDFNNVLTAILGYSQLLADRIPAGDPGRALLDEIRYSADQATTLTRQLLAFSRQQVREPRVLDVNAVVADSETMLRRLIGEDVELRARLAVPLGRVRMDPGQLEQIIVNLVVNSRDAMPEGGTVVIETHDAEIGDALEFEGVTVPPGSYVVLSVSDTGQGMDPATRARIFEPFFTTKEPGKGTGLGLPTVYGIARQNEGHVLVYSRPGEGATFKIYLPRVTDPGAATVGPAVESVPAGGTETVLLVEDEAPLRALAGEFLRSRGYTVLEAGNPAKALQLADERPGQIDLVVTDVLMPGMTGIRLARYLAASQPHARILYVSGHSEEVIAERGILPLGLFFLPKPFTRETLTRKVREVLDSPPPGPGGTA